MLAALLRGIYSTYDFLFSRKIFFKWNRFLFNLSLRGLGIFTNADKAEGYFLRNFLKGKGSKTIFDIGANVGNYADVLRGYSPEASIYCFEPNPRTFKYLTDSSIKGAYKAFQLAVGNFNGKIKFYDYEGQEGNGTEHASLFKDVIENIHHKKSIEFEVDIVTLDEFVKAHNIVKIDLLKIDTEGNELDVLKGAIDTINAGKIEAIQFEFNEMNVISHVFMKDFMDLLKDYRFFRLLQDGYLSFDKYVAGHHEIFAWQNILALRKDSAFKTN